MIAKNPMQLKAFVKNKARESGISPQLVMQNFMMERLLERISLSKYRENLILKGGFLIAAIVGLDARATMDMDATVKGLDLEHEFIQRIFEEICAIVVDDNITFSLSRTTEIREGDIYPGLRVHLTANYSPLAVPIVVDITTGDKITPHEVEYSYRLMFGERNISIMAYNVETILAEKLETILSRGVANTRPRDYYDIYILRAMRGGEYNLSILKRALAETAKRRNSEYILEQYHEIVKTIKSSPELGGFWERYRQDYRYAKDVNFEETCDAVLSLMNSISNV